MSLMPYSYRRARDSPGRRYQKEFTFDSKDFSQVSFNIEAFVVPRLDRGEKKVVSIQDYRAEQEEQEETAREIQRESARIQRELERERRSRSVSPLPTPRGSTPSPPPAYKKSTLRSSSVKRSPAPGKGHNDVKKMLADTAAHFSDAEDQLIAGHELKTLRQALLLTKRELRESEGQLKDARQLSEDAKSTLMVLEFKRGSATKDLDRLNEEIHRRKGQMSAVEAELQAKLTEMKNMTSLGVTREECLDVKATKEENVCLKTKVRNLEGLQLERDELVRQLDIAKEDLLREQKAYRLQCAELQEELETLTARLEETQNGWGNGQEKMAKLDAAYRRMEKEKNEIIQDKIRECEALRTLQKEESDHAKGRLRKEMNELDLEVQEFRVRVNDLSQENGSKDTIIEKMRAQISELQSILVKERDDRHKTSTEQKRALQHLKKETAAAVMKLKESLFLDKQKAVEDLKVELEQERRESGARSEDRLAQMIEDHSYEIQKKNQEIMKLQDSIRKLEKDTQIDLDKQIRDAVSRETERSDKERDWQLRQEREENKRKITDMTSQMERERTTTRELHTEITSLKKELDEQRRQQREASKEKLVAVARAKEQMKDQSSAEIDRVRFNLKQEHERDVARLEEKLQYQLEELTSLRTEHEQITQRERNVLMALEHAEKTVIKEINEECEKVSTILGISPRTVHHTSFHLDNAEGRMSPSFRTRPVLNSALANLRACNEELHNHILELQQEVESLRVMVETVTKEKEEAIENCKLQMEKQRTLDLEKLKDKLLKLEMEAIDTSQTVADNSFIYPSFNDSFGFDTSVDGLRDDENDNLEIDAVDLSREEAQYPSYTPNVSFRLDISRDSDDIGGNEHVQEISEVVRDCAEGKHDHYAYLQRHHASLPAGDNQAVLLAALQAKDEELRALSRSTSLWKAGLEEKFNTQLQLQMAKEREKYQAQQHHSTREQSRISDLQKREIERLERELRRVAASQSHPPVDSNRYRPSSPAPSQLCTPSDKLASATTSATVPSTATVIDATAPQQKSKSSTPSTSAAATAATSVSAAASSTAQPSFRSSQQYLQNRIDQLQAENASLRKNRLFTGAAAAGYHLQRQPMWSSPSLPDLARPQPVRPISPLGRSRSPLNVASRRSISERIRQGEKDALEAEQRARLNQKAMSNKMEEMAQLQNTLISQNQELQELEKAYNDLHKHYCSSRPLSPTSALNTTV